MPSLYTYFVSRVIFPLQERLKKHTTVSVFREMQRSQWQSPQELSALQLSKLKRFLQHVHSNVPYYQETFDRMDFQPDSIKSIADLQRLPFLTKDVIRSNAEKLKANNAGPLMRFNTGGSSGEPLIFWLGNQRVSHDVAAKWRATRWWDVDIGDKEIVVWGSPIELGAQDRIRGLRDKLFRTILLPAFEMSPEKLDRFIGTIRRIKPKMLFGYPSALAHIAAHATATGQSLDNLGIKVAFVTSERLYDAQKQQIEKTFNCRVANGYGGRDAGFIAHQCPQGSMHITAEDIIVEIVDNQGNALPPGQSGEIVVTHLATGDFPFIRYRTGDIGILADEQCSCGRGLPVLKEIQGRATDFVVSAQGTVMHGLALIYILRDLPGIQAFKIIQESLMLTRVMLVTENKFTHEQKLSIQQGFRARLGREVEIRIEEVSEIPPERSGKFRYVVSKVDAAQYI